MNGRDDESTVTDAGDALAVLPDGDRDEGAESTFEDEVVMAVDAEKPVGEDDWKSRYEQVEKKLREYSDRDELAALYPELGKIGSISELDDHERFAELRDAGLSVKEAFLATNSARLAAAQVSKSHIRSSVPKSAAGMTRMSAEELAVAKDIFGDDVSDEVLMKLYRRVTSR